MYEVVGVKLNPFLTAAPDGGKRSASRPGRFTAGKERPVPIA
jgi:hypothetical protein